MVWRDGRVAEGGGLLNRYTVKSRIGGSNPPLSAKAETTPGSGKSGVILTIGALMNRINMKLQTHCSARFRPSLPVLGVLLVALGTFQAEIFAKPPPPAEEDNGSDPPLPG